MATSKNKFINVELEWAESQLATWKGYIDKNPFQDMKDRISWKETKSGGSIPMVVASIESQQKNIRDTMKDYLSLLEIVDRLRTAEKAKEEMRKGFKNDGDILDDEDDDKQ